MATYEEIYGKRVEVLDADPTLTSAYEGQVWYNSASGTLKSVVTSFAFRSGTSLPSGRDYGVGGGATQNASWIAGGEEGSTFINTTFEYNGSGWAASGNMGDARIRLPLGNNGPQTAGLGAGGYSPGIVSGVEEYDGSTWTGGTAMPGALQQAGGAGPQTANIVLGGGNPTTAISYNGSAWASEGSSSEAFAYYGLAGENSEACLAFYGAEGPPGTNRTTGEEYNGTAWTTVVGTLPNQGNSGGAQGTTTAAIFAGNSTTVRSYDGTSITVEPAMTQPRGNGYIGGTATSGITSGGSAPGSTAVCEEFDKSISTITAAAWSSATAMNTGRGRFGSAGAQTSAIAVGGYAVPGNTANTETYDGSSWTETGNIPAAKNSFPVIGSQTACLSAGGYTPPSYTTACDTFNGSSWTSAPAMNTGRESAVSSTASPYTSCVVYGGYDGSPPHFEGHTEEFNGSAWSEQSNMPTAVSQSGGGGTQTAAISSGGGTPSLSSVTQLYNGSSWTTSPATLVSGQKWLGYAGTQTANLIFGGSTNPASTQTAVTQGWDGTAWSTRPSMGTGRYGVGGAGQGSVTAALAFGGLVPSPFTGLTTTEEFNGETETITAKTLTTS